MLKDVVTESFQSMEKFLHVIRSREINPVFLERESRLQNVDTDDKQSDCYFTGTSNYKEAERFALKGWLPKNSVFASKEGCMKANAFVQGKARREVKLGMAGYCPHVPNYLQGRPDAMIYTQVKHQKKQVLKLLFNVSASASMAADQLQNCADTFFKLLDASKYELHIAVAFASAVNLTSSRRQKVCCTVDLHGAALKQIYFALVNPSMLRRLFFRWFETLPEQVSKKYVKTYGYILSSEEIGKMVSKQGYQGFKVVSLSDMYELNETEILEYIKASR